MRICYRQTIQVKQENFSCKKRQITQEDKNLLLTKQLLPALLKKL